MKTRLQRYNGTMQSFCEPELTLSYICICLHLICEILWIIKYTPFLSAMIKLFILYCQSCLPACQFWQKVFTHGYIFRWHACCTKIEWKLKPERPRGPKANPKIIKLWGFRKIPESLDSRCNHLERDKKRTIRNPDGVERRREDEKKIIGGFTLCC